MKFDKAVTGIQEVSSVFSCDLVSEAKKHVSFLKGLHARGITLSTPSHKSLERYVACWLPLVASLDENVKLIPPADVAWLWHCHRLAPIDYERYVQGRFGKLLDPYPSFVFQDKEDATTDEDAIRTRDVWATLYPTTPFFLPNDGRGSSPPEGSSGRLLKGFDIIGSAERQATFLWQVSDPHFQDQHFLEEGVKRYHQFLKLRNKDGLPLVPTYQIDLMWHTHMLVSLQKYHDDCIAIRGEKFHHDDSLNDRTPGAKLDVAFRQTVELWKDSYGQEYHVPHGMYRGEPPSAFYNCQWNPAANGGDNNGAGLVAGSFSSGKSNSSNLPWLDPKDQNASRDGKVAFIPPNPKSRQRGVNNNEKRDGYVFGKGAAGVGFYSLDTRDAYKILYKRLKHKEKECMGAYTSYECHHCLCLGCKPTQAQLLEKESFLEEARKFRDMTAFVKARYDSDGPTAAIPPELIRKYGGRENMQSAVSPGTATPAYCYAGCYDIGDVCYAGGCGGGCSAGGGCG